jgi:hypothetical protein
MRLSVLVLITFVAARAQAHGEHEHVAPPEERAAVQAAEPSRSLEEELAVGVERLIDALRSRDLETILLYCKAPFFFEGKQLVTEAEVKKRWEVELSSEQQRRPLVAIEYFSFDEMVARYGRPPEKLAGWPMRQGTIVVANIGGHAVVMLWRKGPRGWECVGLHD